MFNKNGGLAIKMTPNKQNMIIIINFIVNLSVLVIYAAIKAVHKGETFEITITSDD